MAISCSSLCLPGSCVPAAQCMWTQHARLDSFAVTHFFLAMVTPSEIGSMQMSTLQASTQYRQQDRYPPLHILTQGFP